MIKVYPDKTYGLSYKSYLKIVNEQLKIVKYCKNYKVFKQDVDALKRVMEGKERNNYLFIADMLLREICNHKKQELISFVNEYKPGFFNAYDFIGRPKKEFEKPDNKKEKLKQVAEEESIITTNEMNTNKQTKLSRNDEIFSAIEASEYLGVSYKVLMNKLIKEIPHIRYTEKGRVKFKKSTLDEYMEIKENICIIDNKIINLDSSDLNEIYKKRKKFNL